MCSKCGLATNRIGKVAKKQEAKWRYQGERGYLPMLGHLAENGLVLGEEFREGHEAPASRNLEVTPACAAQMPKGNRIAPVRADSAAVPSGTVQLV